MVPGMWSPMFGPGLPKAFARCSGLVRRFIHTMLMPSCAHTCYHEHSQLFQNKPLFLSSLSGKSWGVACQCQLSDRLSLQKTFALTSCACSSQRSLEKGFEQILRFIQMDAASSKSPPLTMATLKELRWVLKMIKHEKVNQSDLLLDLLAMSQDRACLSCMMGEVQEFLEPQDQARLIMVCKDCPCDWLPREWVIHVINAR